MPTLTEILKKETRKEHAQTEGMMNAKAMFSDDYSLEIYKEHLLHLYKAHRLVHAILEKNKDLLPNAELLPKSRCEDLEKDLIHLNYWHKNQFESFEHDHDFESLAELLSLIYVVKGSELGGNVIGKQIEKHRIRWGVPKAHFYQVTENTTLFEDWKEWCNAANDLATSDSFIEQAIAAAKKAFHLFEDPECFMKPA